MEFTREDADFESEGTRCAAWLYRPEAADPPVVVMAHGFGATRRMGLPDYAERFAARGLAVLLFDYRGFGDSDGRHRNVVDPSRHVADWQAAVEHARSLDGVDGDRVGVWGTSFSGGHALVTAAREDVDAYVGQVPYYGDAPTPLDLARQRGPGYVARSVAAALRDLLRARTFRSPSYVPITGEPGTEDLAPLDAPGAYEGFRSLVPDDIPESEWNRCAARILLLVGAYEPRQEADEVDCPAFVFEAARDQLVSTAAIDEVVETLHDVERLRRDCGHFDPYQGDLFETVVEREADFLARTLLAD
ncbi:MAG: alpha/beta hydrolase [Haloarculaceae archaeon]